MNIQLKFKAMVRMRIAFLYILFLGLGYAQTGPGGVGTTDGTSNLVLWLRADQGVNGSISSWNDQSGYTNTAAPGNSPTLTTSFLNGYDVVTFDGNNDDFVISNSSELNFGSGAFSIIIVYRNTNLQTRTVLLDKRDSGSDNGYMLMTGNSDASRLSFIRGRTFSSEVTSNSSVVIQNQWQVAQVVSDGNNISFYVNGASSGSTTIGNSNLATNTQTLTIGEKNYSGSGARNFPGNIAEVLIFNKAVTDVERIVLENYLANKYNISTASDHYSYSTTHQYDIVGLGRDGSSNTHLSSTSDFLNFNVPSISSSNTYQIMGHNNGSVGSWVTTELPSDLSGYAIAGHISREWVVDNTTNLTNNAVSIPSASLPAVSVGAGYVLLIDSDGNFSTGAVGYPLTDNSGNLVASGISINDNSYVTVASTVPEPTAQPTNLSTSYSSPNVTIGYDAAIGSPDGYIVIRSNDVAFTGAPIDGVSYTSGNVIENGKVIYVGTSTSGIVDNSVLTGTTAYYYVYSYKGTGSNLNYLTTSPLSGTEAIPSTDMAYVSSTVTHPSTNIVIPGHNDRTVIGIEIVTSGNTNPINATSFSINTDGGNGTGTNNPATNLLNARLYYTGTTDPFENSKSKAGVSVDEHGKLIGISEYSDSYYSFKLGRWVTPSVEKEGTLTKSTSFSDQFGSTQVSPNGSFTIAGTKALSQGTNYFFLTYDIASGATADGSERVDAACTSITVGGSARTPSVTQPVGSRVIDQYASSRSNIYSDEHIIRVQFAGVDNSSVGSQYTDYSNEYTAEVTRNNTFDLSVYAVTDLSRDYIIAWIDWNNDGDFNDSGEEYQIGGPLGTEGPHTVSITVPAGAALGTTLMRVSLKYNGYPTNSEVFEYGEVEDYSVNISEPFNMSYTSSTVSQNTNPVARNTADQHVIGIEVVTEGTDNALVLSEITFNTDGTTSTTDISNAKIYYTGNVNASFSAVNQFGSTVSTPNGTHLVTGNQTLGPGTNYFWLTYDVVSGATLNNTIDAFISTIKVNNISRTPSVTAPTGNREIKTIYNLSSSTTPANESEGVLYDDGGPDANYASNTTESNARFTISPSGASQVSITFTDFYYDNQSSEATYDYIYIYDGTSTAGTLLGTYTGSSLPNNGDPISGSSGSLYIYQTSSSRTERRGFTATWTSETNAPMSYTSSTVTQNTDEAGIGFSDQQIVMIEIETSGTGTPALTLDTLYLNTNGTSVANLTNAKVYFTSGSTVFSTGNTFGTLGAAPNGEFKISKASGQTLATGKNYFWLAYDISSNAANGGTADVKVNGLYIGGSNRVPSNSNPSGNRPIRIVESFETFVPTDWDATLGSSATKWTQSTTQAKYGTNSAFTARTNTGSNENRYLVSPRVEINNTDNTLSFWVRKDAAAQNNEGTLLIRIASDRSATGNFTTVTQFDVNSFTTTWVKKTVSLSDYNGMNRYIAFVHQYDGTNNGGLFVDNVVMPAKVGDATINSITLSDYNISSNETDLEVLRFTITVNSTPFQISTVDIIESLGATANTYVLKDLKEGANTYSIASGTATVNQSYSVGTYTFSVTSDITISSAIQTETYQFQVAAPSAISLTSGTVTNTNFPAKSRTVTYNYNYSISEHPNSFPSQVAGQDSWIGAFRFNTGNESKTLTAFTMVNGTPSMNATFDYNDIDSVKIYSSDNASNPKSNGGTLIGMLPLNGNGTLGGKATFSGLSFATGTTASPNYLHFIYKLSAARIETHKVNVMIETENDLTFSNTMTATTSFAVFFDNDVTLPVKIGEFSGLSSLDGVAIKLKTLTEHNAKKMFIERRNHRTNEIEMIDEFRLDGSEAFGKTYLRLDKTATIGETYSYTALEETFDGRIIRYSDDTFELLRLPVSFDIGTPFPNPANPSTAFKIMVPENSVMDVQIYNVLGQRVLQKSNIPFKAGVHLYQWHGLNQWNTQVSSGIYFVQLRLQGLISKTRAQAVQKVILLK